MCLNPFVFGMNVKRLCEEHNVTADEVAKVLGITKNDVHRIYYGFSMMTFPQITTLAKFLNESPSKFIAGIEWDKVDQFLNSTYGFTTKEIPLHNYYNPERKQFDMGIMNIVYELDLRYRKPAIFDPK